MTVKKIVCNTYLNNSLKCTKKKKNSKRISTVTTVSWPLKSPTMFIKTYTRIWLNRQRNIRNFLSNMLRRCYVILKSHFHLNIGIIIKNRNQRALMLINILSINLKLILFHGIARNCCWINGIKKWRKKGMKECKNMPSNC